jgi:phosphomannomutase
LHVTTTPSVSYIARTEDFDCGIMISASHNPFYDNGIKLINSKGEKMREDVISEIEKYLDGEPENIPYATKENIGCTVDHTAGRNRYMGYLMSLAIYSFKGMRIVNATANVQIDSYECIPEGIEIMGAVIVNIFYITSDDNSPMGSINSVIPFTTVVELKEYNKNLIEYTIRPSMTLILNGSKQIVSNAITALTSICALLFIDA